MSETSTHKNILIRGLKLCSEHKDVEFWAYTKSVNYWVSRLNKIPKNLVLTASRGR